MESGNKVTVQDAMDYIKNLKCDKENLSILLDYILKDDPNSEERKHIKDMERVVGLKYPIQLTLKRTIDILDKEIDRLESILMKTPIEWNP